MINLEHRTLCGRYFLRERVGSGGMADVYLAWDQQRSTRMAVKVLLSELAENAEFLEMFRKEAELLRKLEHPHIVRLYEMMQEDEIAFLVMDWIDGTDLRRAIEANRGPYTLEQASQILSPVCTALHYAHQNDVYHCDIKPANILLHKDGRVLLTDFGVARLAYENSAGGTPAYMAPERFNGGAISAAVDIYSLGVSLYEMLAGGVLPFRGDRPSSRGSTPRSRIAWELTHVAPEPITHYNPRLPSPVEVVIQRALHSNPAQRFKTALELRDAFEAAARDGTADAQNTIISTRPVPPSPLPARPPSRPASRPSSESLPAPQPPPRRRALSSQPRPGISPGNLLKKLSGIPQAQSSPSWNPVLVGRQGAYAGQVIPIPEQEILLGRGSAAHLRLPESSVSRIHATLIRTQQGVYLRDEGSTLGTYINGRRIAANAPVQLHPSDIIQIGYSQIFEYRE